MGVPSNVLDIKIRRTSKVMWMMLPLTLPSMPEPFLIPSLKLLKRLAGQGLRAQASRTGQFGFDQSDLTISEDAHPSVNLISVARKA